MVVWSFHEFKFIGNQHWTNKNTRSTCLKWVASFTLTISWHVFTTFSAATYYWANHFNQHIYTWLHGKHGKCNSEYSCQGLHAVAKIRMLHNPFISDKLSIALLSYFEFSPFHLLVSDRVRLRPFSFEPSGNKHCSMQMLGLFPDRLAEQLLPSRQTAFQP